MLLCIILTSLFIFHTTTQPPNQRTHVQTTTPTRNNKQGLQSQRTKKNKVLRKNHS